VVAEDLGSNPATVDFFWGGEICSNGFTSTCIVWAIDKLEKNAIASKRWLKVVAV
jgi:hypothetical protein